MTEANSISRDFRPRAVPTTFAGWASKLSVQQLTLLICFLLYLALYSVLPHLWFRDGDAYWHVLTGQWMLKHWTVPTSDFYSYTAFGDRWIDGEWLSDVVFSAIYDVAGWRGLALLGILTSAAVATALFNYLLQKLRYSVAIGWGAITVCVISVHFLARPHLFSFLMCTLWLTTLLNWYDKNEIDAFPWRRLTLMMVLWVNLHGSFGIGLAILSIFSLFTVYPPLRRRDYRTLGNFLAKSAAVGFSAFLNPYGIYAIFLPIETARLSFVISHIGEWMPPKFPEFVPGLLYFVSIFCAALILGVKVRGPRVVALGLFLVLGLSYFRTLIMFFLTAPILLAHPVASSLEWLRPKNGLLRSSDEPFADPAVKLLRGRATLIVTSLAAVTLAALFVNWDKYDRGPVEKMSPIAAVDFVQREGITGRVYNSFNFGAYLIWRGIPVFIDTRTPPYTDKFVERAVHAEGLDDIDDAFKLLQDYRIDWIILSSKSSLSKALAHSILWTKRYSDDLATVYVRSSDASNADENELTSKS